MTARSLGVRIAEPARPVGESAQIVPGPSFECARVSLSQEFGTNIVDELHVGVFDADGVLVWWHARFKVSCCAV
ncbi:hypothetical protein [Amycolatopsis sp. NPDC058986]|uniref:hypothetical protein n=1 Tax=unclassified Amycolatopsis TaxID=2618356 RepID=UPI00366F3442